MIRLVDNLHPLTAVQCQCRYCGDQQWQVRVSPLVLIVFGALLRAKCRDFHQCRYHDEKENNDNEEGREKVPEAIEVPKARAPLRRPAQREKKSHVFIIIFFPSRRSAPGAPPFGALRYPFFWEGRGRRK